MEHVHALVSWVAEGSIPVEGVSRAGISLIWGGPFKLSTSQDPAKPKNRHLAYACRKVGAYGWFLLDIRLLISPSARSAFKNKLIFAPET